MMVTENVANYLVADSLHQFLGKFQGLVWGHGEVFSIHWMSLNILGSVGKMMFSDF